MTEKPDAKRGKWETAAMRLLAVLLLYVLSVAPFQWLIAAGLISPATAKWITQHFYWPVVWLYDTIGSNNGPMP